MVSESEAGTHVLLCLWRERQDELSSVDFTAVGFHRVDDRPFLLPHEFFFTRFVTESVPIAAPVFNPEPLEMVSLHNGTPIGVDATEGVC